MRNHLTWKQKENEDEDEDGQLSISRHCLCQTILDVLTDGKMGLLFKYFIMWYTPLSDILHYSSADTLDFYNSHDA